MVEGEEDEKKEREISGGEEDTEDIQGGISINALVGSKSKTTLKVINNIGKSKLNILSVFC